MEFEILMIKLCYTQNSGLDQEMYMRQVTICAFLIPGAFIIPKWKLHTLSNLGTSNRYKEKSFYKKPKPDNKEIVSNNL